MRVEGARRPPPSPRTRASRQRRPPHRSTRPLRSCRGCRTAARVRLSGAVPAVFTAVHSGSTCRACSGRTRPRAGRLSGVRLDRQHVQADPERRSEPIGKGEHTLFQQGRFLFRVTPTYTNGSGSFRHRPSSSPTRTRSTPRPTASSTPTTSGSGRATGQTWDLTFGRFQAFDVYPLGMGLDLNSDERTGAYDPSHQPTKARADATLRRRLSCSTGQLAAGDIAFHLYAWKSAAHRAPRTVREIRVVERDWWPPRRHSGFRMDEIPGRVRVSVRVLQSVDHDADGTPSTIAGEAARFSSCWRRSSSSA